MDAEMVRDYALAASGLLVRQIGGPSVKPYQPDGVWEAVSMPESNTSSYKRDSGEDLYRQSMYCFWKRAAAGLDGDLQRPSRAKPARSAASAPTRRSRRWSPSTTRSSSRPPGCSPTGPGRSAATSDDARIDFLARRLVARPLSAAELPIVKQSLADLQAYYGAHAEEAKQLIMVGDSKPRHPDVAQLAAWTMLANELMNLDEVLCR
jgi:hypothetical protein